MSEHEVVATGSPRRVAPWIALGVAIVVAALFVVLLTAIGVLIVGGAALIHTLTALLATAVPILECRAAPIGVGACGLSPGN